MTNNGNGLDEQPVVYSREKAGNGEDLIDVRRRYVRMQERISASRQVLPHSNPNFPALLCAVL